ncbi:hypothetical protein BV25DRAFT_767699 [Artomyces pyxidatus]|uniref:Uncharacterized protein n=1 Tax=Artomyces pyxidatus TaxID=48021 RepID=A0ACB8SYI4_9AGAM|nr:hypothetical protein BV25DRAFT_767699 [Artomyces pyxidatus]
MIPSFAILVDDVLLKILEYLDCKALVSCQATCRKMDRIIKSSVSLQHAIELALCGMVDGPRGGQSLDITERLRRLQLYDAAWRHGRWTNEKRTTQFHGLLEPSFGNNSLVFKHGLGNRHSSYTIPSTLRGVDEKHSDPVVYPTPDFSIMDDSQDLFIRMDRPFSRYHLRALSTGDPHPLAYNHGIINMVQNAQDACVVQVCDDFVLEVITYPGNSGHEYIVRNWKTGIPEYKALEPVGSGYRIIDFLDPEHVLVTSNGRTHPRYSPRHIGLQISPFRAESTPSRRPLESLAARPSYCFAFPPFIQGHTEMTMSMSPWRTADPLATGHFSSNPEDRLFCIGIIWSATGGTDQMHHRSFYIPSSTFYSYMRSHPMTETTTSIYVPWEAWGRMGSRAAKPWPSRALIPAGIPRCIRGMKSVVMDHDEDPNTTKMSILDFHPLRVARAAMLQRRGNTEITILRGNTLGDMDGDGDFEAMLPCTVTDVSMPDEYLAAANNPDLEVLSNVYLCENGVVFMLVDQRSKMVLDTWVYTI